MSVFAIIQARTTSRRLPGKILLPIAGKPVLRRVVERVWDCADSVFVACSTRCKEGDALKIGDAAGEATVCWGSENDVLGRYFDAACYAEARPSDVIVRITSDCPMIDPMIINACIEQFNAGGYDYASTSHPERTVPRGFDVEVFSMAALTHAHFASQGFRERDFMREHVTPAMYDPRIGMRCGTYRPEHPIDLMSLPNFSIDTQEDYERVKRIIEAMPEGYGMHDALARPELW